MLLPRKPGKKRPGANVEMLDGGSDVRKQASDGVDETPKAAAKVHYNAEVEMKGDWNQPLDK